MLKFIGSLFEKMEEKYNIEMEEYVIKCSYDGVRIVIEDYMIECSMVELGVMESIIYRGGRRIDYIYIGE